MAVELPTAVKTKIYKTGQTRGSDDDVVYQNRVGRNSTVLIPFRDFKLCAKAPNETGLYENGFIVLVKPEEFFLAEAGSRLREAGLRLGVNALVFYETREQWTRFPPLRGWNPATRRQSPLGGQYVARVPATTAEGQGKILEGFATSAMKGAGIRVYEYADSAVIRACKSQLEFLFWSCWDVLDMAADMGVSREELAAHVQVVKERVAASGLADAARLREIRAVDADGCTVCPLCLSRISARGFCSRIRQAEGREVPDLTVTEVSLFHIRELRVGEFNHRPYNLGWGHHHCNVVVKDSGIEATLRWMREVLARNERLRACCESTR